MVTAAFLILLTWLFLERTKYGAIMRAGIENKEMVSLLGIDIHWLFTVAFAIGAFLAGMWAIATLSTPVPSPPPEGEADSRQPPTGRG